MKAETLLARGADVDARGGVPGTKVILRRLDGPHRLGEIIKGVKISFDRGVASQF